MFSRRRVWTLISVLTVSTVIVNATRAPPVKIKLASSWSSPPLLVEFLETAALENPDKFFELLDAITDPDRGLSFLATTDQALHETVFQLAKDAGFLSEAGSEDITRRALALHVASPKVEAFYHHYNDRDWPPVPEGFSENDCGSWVDWYGQRVCDVSMLNHLVTVDAIDPADTTDEPIIENRRVELLSFDHIFPVPGKQLNPPPKTAVLYTDLGSVNFRALHSYLYRESSEPSPRIQYVIRFRPPKQASFAAMPLSGFATVLDLKKTEYLAQDDRKRSIQASGTESETGEQEAAIDPIKTLLDDLPLFEDADLVSPLTGEEIPQLGYQAAQLVLTSSDPLSTLLELTNNFPKHMISMARRINVTDELSEEALSNEGMVGPGANIVWVNGAVLQENDVNPFGLLRVLRKERRIMTSLMSLGLNSSEAINVLTHPSIVEAHSSKAVLENLFDSSDRAEGGDVIVWWNDLEADTRYSRWPASLSTLLRPNFPGQPYMLKRNLHNAIFITDLSTRSGLAVSVQLHNLIMRNFPVRFGIVPWIGSEDAIKAARLFYFLIDNYGRARTMEVFKELVNLEAPKIDWNVAEQLYTNLVQNHLSNSEEPAPNFNSVTSGEATSKEEKMEKVSLYTDRLGLIKIDEGIGHLFLNGHYFPLDKRVFSNIQYEMFSQTEYIQESLFAGKIPLDDEDNLDISVYFYDLPTTLKRRNKHIYPAQGEMLRIIPLRTLYSEANLIADSKTYVCPETDSEDGLPISISVLGDMDSENSLSLFEQLIAGMSSENRIYRSSFIHIPTKSLNDERTLRTSLVLTLLRQQGVLETIPNEKLLSLIGSLRSLTQSSASHDEAQRVLNSEDYGYHLSEVVLREGVRSHPYLSSVDSGRRLQKNLGLEPDRPYLLVNGRLIGPLEKGSFMARDFPALADFELKRRVLPAIAALNETDMLDKLNSGAKSDLIATVSSILAAAHIPDAAEQGIFQRPPTPRNRVYYQLGSNHTEFTIGNNETAVFHIGAVLDPLSEIGRRWANLIKWLSSIKGVHVNVHLTPTSYAQIPLKSFYRYHLLPEINFSEAGTEETVSNVFEDLPEEPIYTLAMESLTSWLVRPNESIHDLDNIHLASLSQAERSKGVEASFRLDYLVIEGHSRDPVNNVPTAGLQLQLMDHKGVSVADTMVVANLGYLQLKAPYPGSFGLEIRDERGKEVYYMESAGNAGFYSPNVTETGNKISLISLEGLTLYPRFHKNPGMEREDVLTPSSQGATPDHAKHPLSGVYNKVSSILWGSRENGDEDKLEEAAPGTSKQADINIFTVASGHLYERLSSIMMLSVLGNTNSTVKFWLIENFLSPSFLEFIPHLAKEYNFEYELVTYKWPSWLRPQKEKQRIIWAYKILFLDVLFPMDLKKVIFVDADQIMRADLQELVDLDLKGAPYGYTPMGNDNEDMEGFRFWKTGYWAEVLEGKPYHISALYVVDLERFRQTAAGDRLRGHYQALSADPNSLSNLDQDLPNNMQNEIPIYSLHEDWLWCETWCSMDRFERAKSVDLCFNPLTKESKLVRARKTPGWTEYDNEIAQFSKRLVEQGVLQSALAAADTAALAQDKTQRSEEEVQAPSKEVVDEEVKTSEGGDPHHIRDEL